ncbi:hypothetical protein BGX28_006389 [Mortierella sp. GBA30]|nr:hypothetical protein BGX28_006389 [Mortierella sp. GBA30]
MLKYVKEGAMDLLALTLPSSILESIRQVSEDDFLSPHLSHKQRQPRIRRRNNVNNGLFASRAIARNQRNQNAHDLYSSPGTNPLQERTLTDSRQLDLSDPVSKPSIQLPYEILVIIFQHLPASDLFSILAVNRLWRQIVLMETKQIDLSECFPVDCLGLENEEYSDFDFVYNLFSIFPLISSLVIKDRYMRDRDLRVVTAGILAGKMAFTKADGPAAGTEEYEQARNAIAERRRLERQHDMSYAGSETSGALITAASPAKPVTKVMRGTIQEELREFSRSIGTYVLIPQTRNTLRKKILERLEHNLEQKEIQEYCWMIGNGIESSLAISSMSASSLLSTTSSSSGSPSDEKRYPLVPMTHYRFQDCCFANDWGALMDVNKLPMIGLAAAISRQGLVVDLEGSYGAPSKSIRTMLAFCFGAHCVISLDLNFRHTHMELEHVTELLSENRILHRIDIVDSPAYHDLIRLPALRGLGGILERMHESCLDIDEWALRECLQSARMLLRDLEGNMTQEEVEQEEQNNKSESSPTQNTGDAAEDTTATPLPSYITLPRPLNELNRPIASLSQQLSFPEESTSKDRIRTAKVLLRGVIYHGIVGLINTRDRHSGQSLLHTLAWRRSYASLVAQAMNSASTGSNLPTPPSQSPHSHRDSTSFKLDALSSSCPPKESYLNTGHSLLSASPPSASTTAPSEEAELTSAMSSIPANEVTTEPLLTSPDEQLASISALSSLMSIGSLPAALNHALSFRRLSLPVSTLWIPGDSEDIGVGEGSLPPLDTDEIENERPMETEEKADSKTAGQAAVANKDTLAIPSASSSGTPAPPFVFEVPEQLPVAISLRMAKTLLAMKANPNVYNKDGRSAVVCASYMGFLPMEALLIEHGGYSKELIRIRETM